MGRVREYIKVKARSCWTLFDSGAEKTYVLHEVAAPFGPRRFRPAWPALLGGAAHKIDHDCILEAVVDGKVVRVRAYVIDRIGMDKKTQRPFEVLFGALAMQEWNIELDLKRERLDMSHYPDEFVEF